MGIVALGWHLLVTFGSFLGMFTDIFLILILSWILAFVLEPLVNGLTSKGIPRIWAAIITYLAVTVSAVILIWVILPTTIAQFSTLANTIPNLLPQNSAWATRIEDFLTGTLTGSLNLASSVASTFTGMLLVFILSFYFLLSRNEISKLIIDIIPSDNREDYLFLEKVLNETFASFIQIQVFLGLVMGVITFITMIVLGVNLALSTSIIAAIFAMIPVVGPILVVFPVILATLSVSVQTTMIAVVVIIIAGQLVYNILSPKLLGTVLKIHPIIVLLSFLIGYRLGGVWGAIFAVPVTSAIAIVSKELLKHWKEEADK